MPISDLLFVRAGRFNRRIAIEQQSIGVDSYGQPVPGDWTPVTTCWAEILPFVGEISGFSVKPAQDSAVAPVTINIRYNVGKNVTNQMRARNLTTGQIYRILYVANPDTAQKVVQLACQESTASTSV